MPAKKAKAKEWYSIIAPKMFDEREIGKTMVSDPDNLVGRKVNLSMLELTNDFSKYYMKISFQIDKVDEKKAYTTFTGTEVMRDYISRLILRRVRRIDNVENVTTKDGSKVIVKTVAVAPRRIKSSIQKVIRVEIKSMIKDEVEKLSLEEFVQDILSDILKNKILRHIRRIYPVRAFEIRKVEAVKK
ncbi:MAG: 30S ribosomal protein S3ae [Candidatus Aenigmarchaeota archaeon]|nr:30S ribosomal protein S3ae [Candidatus Aenigmarchaeota archaeon]